ncbi:putative histone-lysine N-methyltransferase (Ash1) [Aspergillus homomorphus CBS 101889]|uniref:SET domain-containing protein n=1 Tax=Aspergillus homomorphus (strain CBS 101889) TaxID=1450537 RepID=A0A395HT35_ASPHC|nr:SET domain-containing protein [Aspergillus homomorphus CBS 101889]RAL10573.1 SET domain-containing protein [Aspergillus homomorphus CBS 101889]
MEGPTELSGASPATPATLADLQKHTHAHADTSMSFEYTEQLLTPENSRSETSSNNEHASHDENPTQRRRSTRVTRASLRGGLRPDDIAGADKYDGSSPGNDSDRLLASRDESSVAEKQKRSSSSSASHLRHSIAVMETTLWADEQTKLGNHPMTPETQTSDKPSQEPPSDDITTSLQRRTLRKRVERVLTQDEKQEQEKVTTAATAAKEDCPKPTRRSTRLSVLDKASDLVTRASSVLGKRSREATEKGKDAGRREGLRPRNLVTSNKEEQSVAAAPGDPASKKRRVSESDLPAAAAEAAGENSQAGTAPAPPPVPRVRRKRWLAHGLYTGQEREDGPPSQSRSRNRRKSQNNKTETPPQRRLLPMPMFAGERLLQNGRDFKLPFDIFSPLPPGQPKPDEWRKTNKNVFVGDAGSIWRANKHIDLSNCMCTEETGCDEDCQNRHMLYECDSGNCRLGPECGNRSFEELKHRAKAGGKYNIGVEVIKTDDRGYGVRSNRTFEPNQVIVEYTGEIITQTECERRMRTVYKNNECYYLMYFDQNMIIDATRGSIARFVNHSCEPNCRMEKWTVAGKPRMALFAGDRGIMTGEELTYDYNFDPYSQKNVQQCRCGASNCRGILGPRPREKDRRAKEQDERQKQAGSKKPTIKRKANNVLSKSPSGITKQRKILTTKAVKAGGTKVVARARASVSKSTSARARPVNPKSTSAAAKATVKKLATTQRATTKRTSKAEPPKTKIKLPTVKATKAKARTAMPKTQTLAKAKPTPAAVPAKSTSKLNRPSAATKAKILAAAKGTNSRRRSAAKKDESKGASKTKSPTKVVKQIPKKRQSVRKATKTASPRKSRK